MTAMQSEAVAIEELIADTARGVFADVGLIGSPSARAASETVQWFADGWDTLVENGFVQAMRGEENGGVGLPAALMLVRLSGAAAINLPLADAMGADWLRAGAGLPPALRPTVFAPTPLTFAWTGGGVHISGQADDVAWGRCCDLVCVGQIDNRPHVATLPREAIAVTEAVNMADEPRDSIGVNAVVNASDVAPLAGDPPADLPQRLGAVLRAAQLAGAAQAAVDMSVGYVGERAQFGRTLSRFQAVQQLLAVMAGEAAAAAAATHLAAHALAGDLPMAAVASAKIRTSEAAGKIAAAAHQLHGAIGFTREHGLQLLSRRLWSWRDEFGSEFDWATTLGRALAAQPRPLWHAITDF